MEGGQEPGYIGEVIRIIGITHNNNPPADFPESSEIGVPVSLPLRPYHPGSGFPCKIRRGIVRRICDDHLPFEAMIQENSLYLGDAARDGLLFVESGKYH
jgi:hypothetical protein